MYLRLYILIFSAILTVGIRESSAEDTKAQRDWSGGNKDAIFIDGEDEIEGSGTREVKDDLESSGSGLGPDDEDGDGPAVDTPKVPVKPIDVLPIPTAEEERTNGGHSIDIDHNTNRIPDLVEPNPEETDDSRSGNDVYIMNAKHEERVTSFFAQPGILAAIIGGAVVGLLCAILVVMFIVYRMRKKDEGSYALDEPKRSPTSNSYTKNSNREFFA